MLQLFSSGLLSLWLENAGVNAKINPSTLLTWQGVPVFMLPKATEPSVENTLRQYLQQLAAQGMLTANQGIWIQSGSTLLINHQGTVPLPAASLTKTATTLAALETWGTKHQFETLISATGPINNGVLQGDLVITGVGDPFFVWEEAIALGNSLNQMGIRQVTGKLVISGNFYMNYKFDPQEAGQLLQLALNSSTWTPLITSQYLQMRKGTAKPQVVINGGVEVATLPNPYQVLLLRHRSMTLIQILKQMNIYSNNEMAEMLARSLGGHQAVMQIAARAANFPPEEIQLINGSGLGMENRISARAASNMFMTIQRYLQPQNLTVADLFPVSGRDRKGTMETRHIPTGTIVKTGTLNEVSALSGVMPTRDRSLVWFTIINRGTDISRLRSQQDQLLQKLLQEWEKPLEIPMAIAPRTDTANASKYLGDPRRNEIATNTANANK